ncbi:MAG TPA: endolytic transglycosylase MltG, partial [Chloroflexi bacterium]|nr:endolytic transglycosylase MltG [Chloroflexota bacterium]
ERPVIAGVYYNRLREGWFLSACPTVQYALGYREDEGTWWKHVLLLEDLEVQSPYNTYRHPGLPPGPIASPGLKAIRAAAFPAETDYHFFMVDCTKEDGSHLFAVTEEEHLANFNRCGGVITSP